ncbi:hypothetical protein QTP70_030306 [Hemibagrus guttatus]|uniref:Rad50/SbcC-type AAA domain-containing protein n=1 Tax=Hemibagrus guttatus TaxID=175788 RepID=A0AAE0PZQ2_9TELE|nr:hypothetical protein QTP70_030306 [Hemibagrus guttatus]
MTDEDSEDNKSNMLRKLNEFMPGSAEVSKLNILIHGPIGSGKSSFVDSVKTALQGHNTTSALADSAAGKSHSFTLKLKIHRVKKDGTFYPFVFTDIMGLEPDESKGVQTEDMIKILHGHIKDGYTFNPVRSIADYDPKYLSNPSLKDKVHCLVSVLPGDKLSLIPEEVIKRMRDVRKKASDLEIPQVVIMTMVDKVCPLVKNLSKIYTSRKVKEKMEECCHRLGVPMNCILPVLNYHEQITNDLNMDLLILMAMTNIIQFANDYVEDQVYAE